MNRRDFLLGFCAVSAGAVALRPARALAGPTPVIEQGFRLVIDPGHGGENFGCRAHREGPHEKEVTLTLAQSLAQRIVELMPHAEVLLTRETDETLHLSQRVGFANACEADLFLSLHCNASPHADQTGFETFVLDVEASSKEAARAAQHGSNDEIAVMLGELGMTNNRKHAALYAKAIQSEQARRFPDRTDRGVRQANFDVLMGARMPAVLHEIGFLDHADESQLMLGAGSRQLVEALAQATSRYYNEVVRRS